MDSATPLYHRRGQDLTATELKELNLCSSEVPDIDQQEVVKVSASVFFSDPLLHTADFCAVHCGFNTEELHRSDVTGSGQSVRLFPESTSFLSQHDALLGVMAVLLDRIASYYVLGPYGSKHRPRGRITLNTIEDMEQCADLNESSAYKWQQFLQVWEDAGWKRWDLLAMVDELRLLLFGRPQIEELIASIDAKQMAVYSSKYSSRQGYRHIALHKALLAFVDVLQKQFSSPSAVLLPAADVFTRLSTTELTSVKSSCMRKHMHGL